MSRQAWIIALLVALMMASNLAHAEEDDRSIYLPPVAGKSRSDSPPVGEATPTPTPTDAAPTPLANMPIGGGEGYGAWVSNITARVSTKSELLKAMAEAQAGDVIYVDDAAVIDLTGTWEIPIPTGVTLASGRGRDGSLGALLHTDVEEQSALFEVQGSDVRITGLRLHGPSTVLEPPGCGLNDAIGISIASVQVTSMAVEIDNNELLAWPRAAISVNQATGVYVHHNYIHHNRRQIHKDGCEHKYGLGYGVVGGGGAAPLIEANLFAHNRHDIASDGTPASQYIARDNLVLNGAVQHSFDMHPCRSCPNREDGSKVAGYSVVIHRNTFLQDTKPAVHIRGIPVNSVRIYENKFLHDDLEDAVWQSNTGDAEETRLYRAHNRHGVRPSAAWFIAWSGRSFWQWRRFDGIPLDQIALGDFDGDGKTDIFRTTGSTWQLSPGARLPWQDWNVSSVSLNDLAFGDFNGDGRTDVFRANGSTWYVSLAGSSRWQKWNTSSVTVDNLAFGDFNGDGRTDVFRTHDSTWYVSWSGQSAWDELNTSNYHLGDLDFGDFNGDGITDVIVTDRPW